MTIYLPLRPYERGTSNGKTFTTGFWTLVSGVSLVPGSGKVDRKDSGQGCKTTLISGRLVSELDVLLFKQL